jgi:Asp-tRNA(Asn)/Glu-tRNA(Gln) amidotransferase A subunit family amidase
MEKRKRTETLEEWELCYLPALKLRDLIRKKIISPVEVVRTFLHRIERVNPIINA